MINKIKQKAFSLIELSAVLVILLLLLGISLSFFKPGPSSQELKVASLCVERLFSIASSMSRAAQKVYMIDSDLRFNSPNPIDDPSDVSNTPCRFLFNNLRIYSLSWDDIKNQMAVYFAGESYAIPLGILASYRLYSTDSDRIYFKPDGQIENNLFHQNIILNSEKKPSLYYKITLDKNTGTASIESYKKDANL
jgi:prepilin-type N-terminal cleavage/methylation domain-containing protein